MEAVEAVIKELTHSVKQTLIVFQQDRTRLQNRGSPRLTPNDFREV